jgi:hypothetical protein
MESFDDEIFNPNIYEINVEKFSNIWSNLNDDYQKSQASSETEKVNDSFLNSGTIDESKSLKKKRKRLDTKDSDSKFYSKYSKSHLKELLKLKEIVVILKKKKE